MTSEELFTTFLQLRRQSLELAIDAGRSGSARTSLCAYLRATICTVRVAAKLFSQQQSLSRKEHFILIQDVLFYVFYNF